jgi:outer membrane protein
VNRKTLLLSLLLALPPLWTTTAAAAETIDLLQVYTLAVEHDASLAVAGRKKEIGMEAVPQGLAPLLPSSALTMQRSAIRMERPLSDRYNTDTYTLSLLVPVFHWERIKGYEKAKKEEQKAVMEYAAAEQELVMRAARLYYDALLALDNRQFARAEKEAMAQHLAYTKARLEAGTAVMTDMHDAQAAFDLAETGVIAADDQVHSRFEALAEVIGRPVETLTPLREDLPLLKPDPADSERWVQMAQTNNLPLKLAALDRDIAESNAEAAVAGHLPAVDMVAAHNYSDSGALPQFDGGLLRSNSLTVQMTLPLYSGNGVSSRVRQAKTAHQMAREAEEMLRRQIVRQTRDGYRGVLATIAQIHATRQALLSATSNLEMTQTSYEAGLRTMTDVVTSQRELFRAKRDHAQARYNHVLQSLGLKQVAGLLSAQDIKAVNEWNRQ